MYRYKRNLIIIISFVFSTFVFGQNENVKCLIVKNWVNEFEMETDSIFQLDTLFFKSISNEEYLRATENVLELNFGIDNSLKIGEFGSNWYKTRKPYSFCDSIIVENGYGGASRGISMGKWKYNRKDREINFIEIMVNDMSEKKNNWEIVKIYVYRIVQISENRLVLVKKSENEC